MKRNIYKEVFWLVAFGALLSWAWTTYSRANPSPAPSANPIDPQWSSQMQKLHLQFKNLLVLAAPDKPFESSAHRNQFEKELLRFSETAQQIDQNQSSQQKDPSLALFSGLLASEAKETHQAMKSGFVAYARGKVRGITATCMGCHQRNSMGPEMIGLSGDVDSYDFSPIEKARYFVSSRNFDSAIAQYLTLKDEDAIREGLSLAVRVKKDPNTAEKFITSALNNPSLPHYLKSDIQKWAGSIATWKKEMKRTPQSPAGLFAEAVRLIARARKAQNFPMDRDGDVDYLRASALLFDLIQMPIDKNKKQLAESFYLLGLTYEALNPRMFETSHQWFYQSCIQRSPHSDLAENCFKRYEESIYFSYTGSRGTEIPSDIQVKLNTLKNQAMKNTKVELR